MPVLALKPWRWVGTRLGDGRRSRRVFNSKERLVQQLVQQLISWTPTQHQHHHGTRRSRRCLKRSPMGRASRRTNNPSPMNV